jgi:signal transduction histidine kinase
MYGNTSEISQVFENLINNANEAMSENWENKKQSGETAPIPLLELSIDRIGNEGIISFTDNGPGIPTCLTCENNERCDDCDAFKVGKTTKKAGSGLGMISIFRTVKKYKGKVKIKTSSTGSSISVTLPVLAEVGNRN